MKGILFDLDGTLIDSMDVWTWLDIKFIESKGVEYIPESLDEQKSYSSKDIPEFFEKTYGIITDTEEIEDFMSGVMIEHYKDKFQFKDGVPRVLDELKHRGFKMCITTATLFDYCKHIIERLGLDKYMEFVQTPDKVNMSKSNPEYFKLAMERLGTHQENTYVFDDALYALKNAKKLNLNTVGIYDESAEMESEKIKEIADIYIESFEELDIDEL